MTDTTETYHVDEVIRGSGSEDDPIVINDDEPS